MSPQLTRFLILLALIALVIIGLHVKSCDSPIATLTSSNPEATILISPEEIKSIEDIGEWVFLNIEDEEIVDTVEKHIFTSDDALSRIYTGNLHFGIDTKELQGKDWFTASGDTAKLALPAIKLLDEDFINEAQTRTFYETGNWDATAMKALYDKAHRQMRNRCITLKNLKAAQDNAEQEISAFIQAFGFKEVQLSFESPAL